MRHRPLSLLMSICVALTASCASPRGGLESTETLGKTGHLLIEIGENGEIGVDGQPVDIRNLRAFIERADVDRAGDAALIMTHRNVSPRVIVQVVDAIKHAGIAEITFAADRRLNGS